uniref:Nucleotide-diphospho-sugar transferase domain-containing protein n=1 Tax=Alexandrium monilatum TaxID=311494 RepID=A0A7S4SC38_9DINO
MRQPSINFDFNARLRRAARLAVCSGLLALGTRPLGPCAPHSRSQEGGEDRPAVLATLAVGEAYLRRLPFLAHSLLATGGALRRRPLLAFTADASGALDGELRSRWASETREGRLRLQRVAVSRPLPASGWVLRLKVFLLEGLADAHQGPILALDVGSVVLRPLEPLLADLEAREADVAVLHRPEREPEKQVCASLLASRPTSGARRFFGAAAQAAMSLDGAWYDDQRALLRAYEETHSSLRLMALNRGRVDVGMEGEPNSIVFHRAAINYSLLEARCGCPEPGCLSCTRVLEQREKWAAVRANEVVTGVAELVLGSEAGSGSCLDAHLQGMPAESGASEAGIHAVLSVGNDGLLGLQATLSSMVLHASAPARLRLHVFLRQEALSEARRALGIFEGRCAAGDWLLGSELHLHVVSELLPFAGNLTESLRELSGLPAGWKSILFVEAGAVLQGDVLELAAALSSSGRAAACAPPGNGEATPAKGDTSCAAGLLAASPERLRLLSSGASPSALPGDLLMLDPAWRSPEGLGEPESLLELTAAALGQRKLLRWGGPLKPWLAGGQWREFWLPHQAALRENLFGRWSPTHSGGGSAWQEPLAGGARAALSKRPSVLVTTSSGFVDFFENWLLAARQALPGFCTPGAAVHLVVVAEDPASVKKVRGIRAGMSLTFEVLRPSAFGDASFRRDAMASGKQGEVRRKTDGYNALMRRRPAYLVGLLERGVDVLLCDLDAVWLRNPFPLLQGRYSGVDVAGADDSSTCKGEEPAGMGPGRNICGGFVYFRATPGGCATAWDWASLVEDQPGPNQPALNAAIGRALDRGDTTIAALGKDEVVSGCSLHDFSNPQLHEAGKRLIEADAGQIVAVHANYLVGSRDKRALLSNVGLWLNLPHEEPKDEPFLKRVDFIKCAMASVVIMIAVWVARRAAGGRSACTDGAVATSSSCAERPRGRD